MMSLYEIEPQIAALTNRLDDAAPLTERDRQLIELELSRLVSERHLQLELMAKRFANLQAFEAAIDSEIKRLKDRKERIGEALTRLEARLAKTLPYGTKWTNGVFALRWSKGDSAVKIGEEPTPPQFQRQKVTYEDDKKLIKETIKANGKVPGWVVETNYYCKLK